MISSECFPTNWLAPSLNESNEGPVFTSSGKNLCSAKSLLDFIPSQSLSSESQHERQMYIHELRHSQIGINPKNFICSCCNPMGKHSEINSHHSLQT